MQHPSVSTHPDVNSGQAHLAGSLVGTLAICDRFVAGETIGDMAADYGLPASHIECALRYELARLLS